MRRGSWRQFSCWTRPSKWASSSLSPWPNGSTWIPGAFDIQFIENDGMAFGWALPGATGKYVLTGFPHPGRLLLSVHLARISRNGSPRRIPSGLGPILAGAAGNILDSVFYGQLFSRSSFGQPGDWAWNSEWGGLCALVPGQRRGHAPHHGAMAFLVAGGVVGRPRGLPAHLQCGRCGHHLRRGLDPAQAEALARSGASTQSPCERMSSMRASTAPSSGMFRSTTSFSLYKVILPGPVPT